MALVHYADGRSAISSSHRIESRAVNHERPDAIFSLHRFRSRIFLSGTIVHISSFALQGAQMKLAGAQST